MPQTLIVRTAGQSLVDITAHIEKIVAAAPFGAGLSHLFIQHTSASLVVQENADPDVQRDLIAWFNRAAPEDGPYLHTAEGPDDMPAHIKSALTATSLSVPFADGSLMLGRWQGIYLFEHRRAPQCRHIVVTLIRSA